MPGVAGDAAGARPGVPAPRGRAHLRALELAGRDLHAAVAQLNEELGPAFAFGFGPIRFHWFVGPDAARTILRDELDAFSQRGGYDFLRPVGGDTALISSDEPEHLQRRRRVQPAFHGRQVASWLATGEGILEPWLAERAALGQPFDLYREARPRLVRIVARIVLGDVPLARDDHWLRDVDALMDFPGRPMLEQQWKLPIPGTPWARFTAARRRVDDALYAEIARRRADASGPPADDAQPTGDVLGLLMASPAGEGELSEGELSDRELRDQSLSLISAGFDTTAAALAWCLAMADEHPEQGARLAAELAHGDPASAQAAPYTDAFVKETLRLRPPAAAALRRTVREVEILGHVVPAGSRVALSILRTHLDPASFHEPDRFDPERFVSSEPPPFAYLPFGYGVRHCIGAGTATALIKTGLALTLGRYRVEPLGEGPRKPVGMTLHPEGGLQVRVHRR
ncbi:MAG: cytochrome P450 [Trueperaceae bacterium]|nr:cytochrome P450 [Trueperaceae bacterium]